MKTGKIVAALTALALVFLSHMANAEPSAPLKAEQLAPDFNLPAVRDFRFPGKD
ncbi:hypothetical protein [Nitrosospira multiformis]|uniref:hypothetical protein n=1 Tax=Nitrosospira multiformis TaxID=1231 RepID=UPI0008975065|nr:hypothetical protein [Nitrosospira multiformis]SEA67384.1 hypothetical protein SAMN05216411_11837 [Nitrosospira multiformis]